MSIGGHLTGGALATGAGSEAVYDATHIDAAHRQLLEGIAELRQHLTLLARNADVDAADGELAGVQDEITRADTQSLGVPLPHPQTGDKRLRALCEAVLRAPAERATLADWAADIGASERTMARLFREELGTSYQQWRQQAVLAHALPLLARGTPVSEVAAASGYASDSAFSAMFKAAMGHSPSRFAASVRGQ